MTSLRMIGICFALSMVPVQAAMAEDAYVVKIRDYLQSNVRQWIKDPVIIEAIKAQNTRNAALKQADIDALDQEWRGEVEIDTHPLIDSVLGNAVSTFLKQKQESSDGMITEAFVMDDKGLNVGQSAVTSDYWQGDEAKFQKTFGSGAGAVFVEDAQKDESTQMLQAQASMTIVDEDNRPIGAITVGINLDKL